MTQKLLAPGSARFLKKRNKDIFGESRGLVLDVGCGPLLTTPPPPGTIVGIDINLLYVKKYPGIGVDKNQNSIQEDIDKRTYFGVSCSADGVCQATCRIFS